MDAATFPQTPATAAGVPTLPMNVPRMRAPLSASSNAPASMLSKINPRIALGVGIGVVLLIVLIVIMTSSSGKTSASASASNSSSSTNNTNIKVNAVRTNAPMVWKQAAGQLIELDEAAGTAALSGSAGTGPAVIMVYAPWCGACKVTKPAFESAANESKDVRFAMVDGMQARGLMTKFSVTAFPTIFGVRADNQVVKFPANTPRNKEQLLKFAAALKANTAA